METFWGIDLGGTKIEGAVLHSRIEAKPICRLRVNTEAEGGYEHILSRIKGLVDAMAAETGHSPKKIGLAHPGSLDSETGLLKNSNTLCLNGQPVKEDLKKLLGVEVVMANDANCFALAEALLGAGRNAESVFGVIMGTGVGGGLVINGQVLNGCQGLAGEWGHNVLLETGPACYCGKRGCVESIISGVATEKYYESLTGKKILAKEIVAKFEQGEDGATKTIHRLVEYFGKAISVVINIFDPHVIVLGGGLSNIGYLRSQGRIEAERYAFLTQDEPRVLRTKIVGNELGDSAGVFGAAML
jgi:fructokinase